MKFFHFLIGPSLHPSQSFFKLSYHSHALPFRKLRMTLILSSSKYLFENRSSTIDKNERTSSSSTLYLPKFGLMANFLTFLITSTCKGLLWCIDVGDLDLRWKIEDLDLLSKEEIDKTPNEEEECDGGLVLDFEWWHQWLWDLALLLDLK